MREDPIVVSAGKIIIFMGSRYAHAVSTTGRCLRVETFRAQCDIEPVGCPFVWLLLMMSIALHVVRCCVYDSDDESDEESESEKSTMYT